MVRQSLWNRYS